ncbi:MAG: GntR family transcriptional regulator [Desulfatirhabdiaceae bacterium]
MEMDDSIKNETKAEKVHRRIKQAILKGEIAPGEKMVISQLAQKYKTSIIPVREALGRLEAENLVTVIPHTGTYAREIDLKVLREIYPLRGILEGYAVRLASQNLSGTDFVLLKDTIEQMDKAIAKSDFGLMGELNTEFHMIIYRASQNNILIQLIEDFLQKTFLARLVFRFKPYRAIESNKEHLEIVEALENGMTDTAERLIILQSEKTLGLLNDHLVNNE